METQSLNPNKQQQQKQLPSTGRNPEQDRAAGGPPPADGQNEGLTACSVELQNNHECTTVLCCCISVWTTARLTPVCCCLPFAHFTSVLLVSRLLTSNQS